MLLPNQKMRFAGCLVVLAVASVGCQTTLQEQPHNPLSASASSSGSSNYLQEILAARNLENAGDLDQARRVYEPLIQQEPERFEALHRLAVVSDRQKRFRESHSLYRRAIELRPNDAVVRNDFGYSLFLNGKLEEATRQLRKAVELNRDSARFRNNLAMSLGHQGRHQEALEMFKTCNSEADAHYNMAFVLASQEKFDAAIDHFRKTLALDPSHGPAAQALKSFQDAAQKGDNHTASLDELRSRDLVPYVEPGAGSVRQVSLPNPRTNRRAIHAAQTAQAAMQSGGG